MNAKLYHELLRKLEALEARVQQLENRKPGRPKQNG